MIKIENTEIYGWESAIRGMRNPLNSWKKSDSEFCNGGHCSVCKYANQASCVGDNAWGFVIGDNDLKLMKRLVSAGSDHSKFMRMITVTVDITAPLYWWKEYDAYMVGTVRNSCSTMHKIADKKFTLDDFSCEHLDGWSVEGLVTIIDLLNKYRFDYLETNNKDDWWQMIQLLPSGYNQRATVQLNYAVLRNMYHARKNHKLDEWRDFCKWIETLPYSELITEKGD